MATTATPSLLTLAAFQQAQTRIRGIAARTPLVRLFIPGFDAAEIYVKAEGLQPIGSFKLRGAYNKVAQLTPDQRSHGVITYSSGNHAQGVAYAARVVGAKAVIVMPSNAPEVKKRATAALGAEIVEVGPASSARKEKAEELEAKFGYVMIPPYDDEQIIAGQGTCGLEILEDLPDVDLVLSPVSGGGLLSGVATAIKLFNSAVRVIGVEPELAAEGRQRARERQSACRRPGRNRRGQGSARRGEAGPRGSHAEEPHRRHHCRGGLHGRLQLKRKQRHHPRHRRAGREH